MKAAAKCLFGRALRDLHSERRLEDVWPSTNAYGGMVFAGSEQLMRMRGDGDPTPVLRSPDQQ